ncbi:hypothetical protein QFC20_003403 [Naganishia adeliensis]|uniref:Uncharacterized protein n=1 Tax=Naganishia adeliensis TaxID=92952 RepID=A0ACC2WD71_9TREE|nr:hypothetical protein QFC20_003403 [Naganishia adeliensis]
MFLPRQNVAASKNNESSPLSAVGSSPPDNSLLGLSRSIHPQAFFEGFRCTIVYSLGFQTEAEQRSTAATVFTAISQEEKLTLESNGKIILSDGKTIESQQTTMSGVQGYRKLGGRLVGAAALKIGIRKNVKRAIKLFEATGVSKPTLQLGFVALAFLTVSWLAWRGWISSIAYMLFGAMIWRSLPSRSKYSQSFRAKKDGETCSTAVFLGSGGHTGEAIQLLSALDATRYTPRTYIFCTGDSISLTKATSLENELRSKSSLNISSGKTNIDSPASYRLMELPRARRVAQSYFSAIGTTAYSLLVTFWKLAVEPIVKGDLKQIPDLLIVNGPGTCVVVVLVYKLLKLLGHRSPQIIYVESFARVNSLSLSGKILKNVVDEFIVQWPVEGYVDGQDDVSNGMASKVQDSKLQYQGWLI